jgi:hydroxypyruvate isomerase
MMNQSRRTAIKTLVGGAAALGTGGALRPRVALAEEGRPRLKGNIKHSVCKWCYPNHSIEELAIACREIGIESIEIIGVDAAPILQRYDLTCAMANGPGSIPVGFNRVENHDALVEGYERLIPQLAAAGWPAIIAFSGNRDGLDDEQGIENTVRGLQRVLPTAERYRVNVVMEGLNSKVDHRDYHYDKTAWGVEVAKRIESDRFSLLYDIYHMQIMEGDVIRTIRDNHQYISHYHTAGVPGRNEIDESQELFYPPIVRAIVETGYDGYLGQEFVPTRDPLTSLREAVELCDV